jgi:hypothetical protein
MPEKKVEKELVFPHLTFRELIATMAVILVLIWVSMLIDAPLEELANPSKTPNPAKAPWYFVGLQELLVYFDPWVAGVTIPALIIIGLIAIPFVDKSGDTNGVPGPNTCPGLFASTVFAIGVTAWFALIVIGFFFAVQVGSGTGRGNHGQSINQ